MDKHFQSILLVCATLLANLSACAAESSLRVATFNVSIEATNYLGRSVIADNPTRSSIVQEELKSGDNQQIKNIAEIIQRTRPDILLLNEFDYIPDPNEGVELFIQNYLAVAQNDQAPIAYPYYFIAPVNTGIETPFDLDNDGLKSGNGADAYGFGFYPGHFGMALLSRYPIQADQVKTLQQFLWKDMPGGLEPMREDDTTWYSEEEWANFRLSSKSHWDVPIKTNAGVVHLIAAHPTPPTFDGPENRNGKRNHDEIRLIEDYVSNAPYLYADDGSTGGIPDYTRFIILGDLNSSPNEGDSLKGAIKNLLAHPLVDSSCVPVADAAQEQNSQNPHAASHTAAWGLRVDYVLPSRHGLDIHQCGMFWPTKDEPLHSLIATRGASSDHRLVWLDVELK